MQPQLTLIYNATLILPDKLVENGWLLIEDGRILELGDEASCPAKPAKAVDGETGYLLPGLIDLHCDAIEKLVEPRPGIHFDLSTAFQEADLRLAASGITTEFHAISLDDNEFGVRSDTFMHDLRKVIDDWGEDSLVRHKLHARLELSSERGNKIITQMIEHRRCEMISLMDHSPGQGQFRSMQAFSEYVARTTNKSTEEIDLLVEMKRTQIAHMPQRIRRISRLAREAGLAVATHDDDTAAKVEQWPALGVSMSEFPTTMEAARRAHELGLAVCMGAPNVLRGQSSSGNLSALEAIQARVIDVLCSDYYPTAMLGAVFTLVKSQVLTLPQATQLVTINPARAAGLQENFGSLETGKVADMILVKRTRPGTSRVVRVFVGGKEKFKIQAELNAQEASI